MIVFKKSPVVFNEEDHRYQLGDKQLLGITGLIHNILGLGVYPDAEPYTQDYVIPRAGSRGTAVHHAIQTYDLMGLRQTYQIVHTKYGCRERDNIHYVDEEWDVENELDNYIRNLTGCKALANELTVSDERKWASQIDNVWENEQTGGIWLVDTKTNNVKLYPTCGYFKPDYFPDGVTALKEYLSWQLSIYAELFEQENPRMKVEGLACNWLRKDESEFWIIDRKPSDLVWELLSTEYMMTDNGPVYFHHDVSIFGIGAPTEENLPEKKETALAIQPDVVKYVADTAKIYEDAKKKLDDAKTGLRKAMEEAGMKKYDSGLFTAIIAKDSEVETFDTKAFKAKYPEIYKEFVTKKSKKGGFTLKIKTNG